MNKNINGCYSRWAYQIVEGNTVVRDRGKFKKLVLKTETVFKDKKKPENSTIRIHFEDGTTEDFGGHSILSILVDGRSAGVLVDIDTFLKTYAKVSRS